MENVNRWDLDFPLNMENVRNFNFALFPCFISFINFYDVLFFILFFFCFVLIDFVYIVYVWLLAINGSVKVVEPKFLAYLQYLRKLQSSSTTHISFQIKSRTCSDLTPRRKCCQPDKWSVTIIRGALRLLIVMSVVSVVI